MESNDQRLAAKLARDRGEKHGRLRRRGKAKDSHLAAVKEKLKRDAEEEAARVEAEALERASRASDNQARVMADRSSELRSAFLLRTDRAMRLQRVEQHKRLMMQHRVEAKHAKLAAIKRQQSTLKGRREKAMHELFLKEQKEAMNARGGAVSAPVSYTHLTLPTILLV